MDIGQIWSQGVVGSLEAALIALNDGLLSLGLHSSFISSWALTIILFTIIIKLVTLPLTLQQLRSSKAMQDLQPHLQVIQKTHAKDREKLAQEQMRLYKEHGVNPAAGCLPMIIQMPVWIGLYQALFALGSKLEGSQFLWITSLSRTEIPGIESMLAWPPAIPILAIFTGATQWLVQKMMTPHTTDPQQQMTQSVMQLMPLMFIWFSITVPAGLVLYWVTSNLFSIVQQYFITGWGSLVPPKPGANLVIASPGNVNRKTPAVVQTKSNTTKASPSSNGQSDSGTTLAGTNGYAHETGSLGQTVSQTPPGAKKRRRRNDR